MYLKKIILKNIKCFANLEIDFSEGESVQMWTTLFGKNGLGKSTLLQAIGATLAGPSATRELLPVAEGWVRRGEAFGEIEAHLLWTNGDAFISGWPKTKTAFIARYIVTGEDPEKLPRQIAEEFYYTIPTLAPWSGEGTPKEKENIIKDMRCLQQTAYAEGKPGWMGCGYGPFRRLSGGGRDADKILYAERKAARFVTLFREDAALTNATEWLIKLHNTAREGNPESKSALEQVKNVFKSDIFPEPAHLEVGADSARLQLGTQKSIPLHDLSDGYRSMLALTIDLLRWLTNAFPEAKDPLQNPGVVLIDELDAHLHPEWQRNIGHWLRDKFPNIQFIIATHSPFLAQVAEPLPDDEAQGTQDNGHLGGNMKLELSSDGVIALFDKEASQNFRADQILQSPLFGMGSLYSPKVEKKLHRQQELHIKQKGQPLSPSDKQEYEQLILWRENLLLSREAEERTLEQTLREAVLRNEDEIKELS